MRTIAVFLTLFLTASGCTSAYPEVEHDAGMEKVEISELALGKLILENNHLQVTLFPDVNGGIENVTLKEKSLPLLWGGKLEEVSYGPLVVYPQASGVLFVEKFWKGGDGIISNMLVKSCSPDSVVLYCPEYGRHSAAVTRKITVEKDALAIHFDVDVKFSKMPSKGYFSPWLNLMPSGDIDWVAAIPALGGEVVNGLNMKTDFPATGIYRGGWHGPNTYFTPARNWIAVSSPGKNTALALISKYDRSQCTFYSWKGNYSGKTGRTVEIIMPELILDKDLCGSYQYMLAVFPGISDLREIINDTAIEYHLQGKKLNMRFCSVRNVPAQQLEIFVTVDGNIPVSLGKKQLPELNAGKVTEVKFDLPEEKFSGTISGSLNGEQFTILPVIRRG